MNYSKVIISEVMKSTFLTLALFILFDIIIQGYSAYHNWVLTILTGVFSAYCLIIRHHSMHKE